jgi:hypothetical protein
MIASTLFQLSLFLGTVIAAPATSALDYHEGYNSTSLLVKRYDPQCVPLSQGNLAYLNAAYCCRDQLNARGGRGEMCTANNRYTPTTFCDCTVHEDRGGRAVVAGLTTGSGYESVNCADVARGMQWIIDNCKANNPCACVVGGLNAAWGNGNLIIAIRGS